MAVMLLTLAPYLNATPQKMHLVSGLQPSPTRPAIQQRFLSDA